MFTVYRNNYYTLLLYNNRRVIKNKNVHYSCYMLIYIYIKACVCDLLAFLNGDK